MLFGLENSVAKTLGVALTDVVDIREAAGLLHLFQLGVIALGTQRFFQAVNTVEVVLQRALVASGDHEDIVQPRIDNFFNHVLDGRLIDHRQHFLRNGLRSREETCTESRNGDNSLADFSLWVLHAGHSKLCQMNGR